MYTANYTVIIHHRI